MFKLTDEQFERFIVFAERLSVFAERFTVFVESVHKLPDKIIDTNLILSVLIIQALLVGVCTLHLQILIYKTLIPLATLELLTK